MRKTVTIVLFLISDHLTFINLTVCLTPPLYTTYPQDRVAQWLERRAQESDDPCVGGSNPTVGRGCRSFG
jgi:hypothetical protein